MWKKLGKIYSIQNDNKFMHSHASYPTIDVLDDKIRIYFSSRDNQNVSRIFYFDYKNKKVFSNNSIVVNSGIKGEYDCDGIAPRCIVNNNSKKIMYTIGWNQCKSFPYSLSIGICENKNNIWQKIGQVLGRNRYDKIFCTSPHVIYENRKYKMWYCSCNEWSNNDPNYFIKYTESKNGYDWDISDTICISKKNKSYGWPYVIKKNNYYTMYYCSRHNNEFRKNPSKSYKIMCAYSQDGIKWDSKNQQILKPSIKSDDWDSEMVCYPAVHENLMFYNGNGFGKTGIGIATNSS